LHRRDFLKGSLAAGLVAAAAGPAHAWSRVAPRRQGLPRLVLPHHSGARVELYLQGAHVASWIQPNGEEALFMSSQSRFAHGEPIRGGIPVVFPQFANLGPLPGHGLVRTRSWSVIDSGTDAAGAAYARLKFASDDATRALWPHAFEAELTVSLDEALAMRLSIANLDGEAFSFQSALHTYFRVDDIHGVSIEGLDGRRYLDRTAEGAERVAPPTPLRIRERVDRVYVNAPDRLVIRDASSGRVIEVVKQGFADAVVWNPWAEVARSMPDFGEDEYLRMVCLEPANVASPVRLQPGESWSGTHRIRIHPL
jgi:glucose-6-phosphate 1-epimerase